MDDHDLVALGEQYRQAKAAIGVHRQRQAEAEVAYNQTWRRHAGDLSAPAVVDAQATVDKAVVDVEWCKAVTVAAGETYKGQSFDDVTALNHEHRAEVQARHQQAMSQLEGS